RGAALRAVPRARAAGGGAALARHAARARRARGGPRHDAGCTAAVPLGPAAKITVRYNTCPQHHYLLPMADRPHLLIVDDDREIRSLLSQYLEKNEFRTTAVPDGREMRRVLDRAAVDLIVLDLMLPGEDGLTLCRELRTHS